MDACEGPSIPNFKRFEKELTRLFYTHFSAQKKERYIPKNKVNKKQDCCKLMTKTKSKLRKQHQSSSQTRDDNQRSHDVVFSVVEHQVMDMIVVRLKRAFFVPNPTEKHTT